MPKKQWTDEERKAFGIKMKAAREKREAANNEQNTNTGQPAPVTPTDALTTVETISQEDLGAMLRYIKELEAANYRSQTVTGHDTQVAHVQNGTLTGTVAKYSTDKNKYADPCARLAKEPRLQRFAFDINYELDWHIDESRYETIDHVRMVEPKFTLELNRIMMDEETGQPTNGRYTIARLIMHEDPEAAITIARQQGLSVETDDEELFLNEMRYLRARDWLLECFYPPKPTDGTTKKDMVIGNKLVQYFEVNSEESARIPFNQLENKL